MASTPYRLAFSLSVIYGSFTLGFYVAIQGPTLMDLIDLLHVNNDIMSYSLAFASLAYSLGGLLSGLLFNYVDRQILIPGYYIVFGVANFITPYISNYYVFSAITVFKMMCAGGTDCGANVWILDMWPGQDAWLQALHFSFACGTALGPLVVEPFLSAGEHKDTTELEARLKDNNGHALISDQSTESRIYIPYGVSGLASIFAAVALAYLHVKAERIRKEECRLRAAKQLAASGEHILMNAVQHPAAIEAGLSRSATPIGGNPQQQQQHLVAISQHQVPAVPETVKESEELPPNTTSTTLSEGAATSSSSAASSSASSPPPPPAQASQSSGDTAKQMAGPADACQNQQQSSQSPVPTAASQRVASTHTSEAAEAAAATTLEILSTTTTTSANDNLSQLQANQLLSASTLSADSDEKKSSQRQLITMAAAHDLEASKHQNQQLPSVKFTSKAKEQADGRPPYYVMFAIALCALCLSFYCGIEITSMNYLATFAVNIDLQLPKSTAALMSSALTISFAVGRLIGIWIAAYMKPHKLFYLCSCVMAAGNLCILLFANTTEMLLWYSICLFGIGCGPMYASIVSFYDDRISKVTNTVSGIFILGSMFNVALNSLIIGHYIIDNALILIVCNLIGSVLLLFLFGSLHMLTKVKKNQRKRKYNLQQMKQTCELSSSTAQEAIEAPGCVQLQVAPAEITAATPLRAIEIPEEPEVEAAAVAAENQERQQQVSKQEQPAEETLRFRRSAGVDGGGGAVGDQIGHSQQQQKQLQMQEQQA